MVNYCCVIGCGRNSRNSKHLYFYGIPKDQRQEQWLEAAGRADILNKPQEKRALHRVCSRHFSPASFKNKHLCADAMPTLCLPGREIGAEGGPADESDDEIQVHRNISCDNCGDSITRFRYKCVMCPNYDLCSRCEMTEAHSQHFMLRIPAPTKFKNVDKMVKKWQAYYKEANAGNDSSDDEPITKYVKSYDSGIDLSDDVKESIRNEVSRVLDIQTEKSTFARKKKKSVSRKRPSVLDKPSKMQKVETVNLPDLFSNTMEMVFADVNEIHSVGSSQPMDVKNEVPVAFERNEDGLMKYLTSTSGDAHET